ncbi:MAG: four helix bundle protein [Bacteroidales bacterium]|nr:four helix bundle protein [Bacteroidales bacterium]MBR6490811.1 four helix bundle protein [Bacteroidales bacterium]
MKNILQEKSKKFAIRIVNMYKYLVEEKKEFVISKQILRSGTSIGANIHEGRNAESTADFVHKKSIALKEADETQYWLELLVETDYINKDVFDSMNSDLNEIIAMLISSIKTLKKSEKQ